MKDVFLITLLTFICSATVCDGIECCLIESEEVWCDRYCCEGQTCCPDEQLRIAAEQRIPMCLAFFSQNVWAPVAIVFIIFGMSVVSCLCCIKCCYW